MTGKECNHVQRLVERRIESEEFARKISVGDPDWKAAFPPNRCAGYLIRGSLPLRAVGWAEKLSANSWRMVVGLEFWMAYLPAWLVAWQNDAIDHELTHVWQNHDRQLFNRRWNPELTLPEYLALWLEAEWEAIRINTLIPRTIFIVFLPPAAYSLGRLMLAATSILL
jgi:hypothetical protein